MKENIREIVTAYLLLNNSEPVIFSSDEDKINDIMVTAMKRNISLKKKNITSNKNRILEIGNNLFKREVPIKALEEPITFRNLLIKEWHDNLSRLSDVIKVDSQISWGRICKKYNVSECTVDEFSRWMFDINEYIKGQ